MSKLAGRSLEAVIAAGIGLMVVAALMQVISRYVFGSPLGWTEEAAKFLMVWWTFLGVGLLAWRGRLLGIDAVLIALPARTAHLLLAGAQALSAVVIVWLAVLGVRLVGLAGAQITPALDVPYAWIYASLPTGLAVASMGFAWRVVIHLRQALLPAPAHPVSVLERSDA